MLLNFFKQSNAVLMARNFKRSSQNQVSRQKKLAGEKRAVRTRHNGSFFHYVTSLHAHMSCIACSSRLKRESETESQDF